MEGTGATTLQCGFGERCADNGAAIHIVGDKEFCKIRGNPEATPGEAEEGFVNTIEGSLDVPG